MCANNIWKNHVNREPHTDDHSDITDDSQGGSVEIYCNVCKCACNADGNKNWFKCTVGLTPECSKSDFGAKWLFDIKSCKSMHGTIYKWLCRWFLMKSH